jgi:hypothetical protein
MTVKDACATVRALSRLLPVDMQSKKIESHGIISAHVKCFDLKRFYLEVLTASYQNRYAACYSVHLIRALGEKMSTPSVLVAGLGFF